MDHHIAILGDKAQITQPGYGTKTFSLEDAINTAKYAAPHRRRVLLAAANLLHDHQQSKKKGALSTR
jgi:hypothetical protein